jgi:hypothetical protein
MLPYTYASGGHRFSFSNLRPSDIVGSTKDLIGPDFIHDSVDSATEAIKQEAQEGVQIWVSCV